jgi:uncharacterized HhH-GPD family protein
VGVADQDREMTGESRSKVSARQPAASRETRRMRPASLYLSGNRDADDLLATDPLALLIAMVLDQQIPLERAFGAPAELRERLGDLDAAHIATLSPDAVVAVFSAKPALHRFPGSMAKRVQQVCQVVLDDHEGNAADIWEEARDGEDLRARLTRLPGFGEQKARIFAALLGKQFGVRPPGWREACAPFGEPGTFQSVADIVDPASLAQVRATKQAMKAAAKAATP